MKMEFLREYLTVSALIKDDEPVLMNYREVVEKNEIMKLLNEVVTRDLKTEKKDENN